MLPYTRLLVTSNSFFVIPKEMHQYLDSDSSGTSGTCTSSTIGAERLQVATSWLKQYGFKGFLGEMGAGSNSACISAVQGALCAMQQSGVWLGFTWWAAGPWWGTVRFFPLKCRYAQRTNLDLPLTLVFHVHWASQRGGSQPDPSSGPQAFPVMIGRTANLFKQSRDAFFNSFWSATKLSAYILNIYKIKVLFHVYIEMSERLIIRVSGGSGVVKLVVNLKG